MGLLGSGTTSKMARKRFSPGERCSSLDLTSASTVAPSDNSSSPGLPLDKPLEQDIVASGNVLPPQQEKTVFEREFHQHTEATYSSMLPRSKAPFKLKLKRLFGPGGKLRPFRLLRQDIRNIRTRYISDWTTFNQLVVASAVYVFFTNILPGITFASDLYVLTGMTWGTIEVVFSTGLCGIIFSL